MRDLKEFSIDCYRCENEEQHKTEIAIMCDPATLIVGLSEAILKINEAMNNTGRVPHNFIWTMVAEAVGDDLLEKAEDK